MTIQAKWNGRKLRVRWGSTVGATLGIALVVAVFVMVMSVARGLRATYLSTGDPRNLLVLRKGAMAESSSQITLDDVRRTKFLDGIARNERAEPLAAAEIIVLITMDRTSGGKAHVQVRGISPMSWQLRPGIKIVQGRRFQPGRRECVVSRNVARRFENCRYGQRFRSGKGNWEVVRIFYAQRPAYHSPLWLDPHEPRQPST